MREVVNAIYYLSREGCSWRALPHDFPPWKTVYNYGETEGQRGQWPAVEEFLAQEVFRLKERSLNNHGLTVLERVAPVDGFTG